MAARELVPVVHYEGNEDLEVFARGVTMSWKEDGDPIHYRGNARIQMMKATHSPNPRPLPEREPGEHENGYSKEKVR